MRREREQEIKRLAEHNEQFRNELTCYQNSQVNVEIMLKKNVAYKRLFHYDWLRQDISEYLEEGKNKKKRNRDHNKRKLKRERRLLMKEVKEVVDTVSVALANGQPEEAGNVVMQEVNHALLSMGVDEAMADKIDNFIILLFIIGIALLANLICRKIILRTVAKLVRQTKATWMILYLMIK